MPADFTVLFCPLGADRGIDLTHSKRHFHHCTNLPGGVKGLSFARGGYLVPLSCQKGSSAGQRLIQERDGQNRSGSRHRDKPLSARSSFLIREERTQCKHCGEQHRDADKNTPTDAETHENAGDRTEYDKTTHGTNEHVDADL